ncbi:MAG: PQQ-dependent sugar dehydrogenase [Rubrivivax sp.]|nr:PQQ-dependent sugar dehydrogenase [Rubrivivax sp.]
MQARWIAFGLVVVVVLVLPACGGGGGNGVSSDAPAANQAPKPSIDTPAANALFSGGQTLTLSVSAIDAEDGALSPARLTWWAELHHDAHTHPFQPETTGASGSVTIPPRGETSDNIFYRLHLRATDSGGAVTTVTRDVLPRKARITLASQPAGLKLTLDGQPVAAPNAFTGVVGMERDIGAADQDSNGRRYRFNRWSDGGAATHVLITPAADTTLTATFDDIAPVVNQAPSVSLTAPATANTGVAVALSASATDSDGRVLRVEFFDGATSIGQATTAPYTLNWTPATAGARSLTARATDDTGASTTSAAVAVAVTTPTADAQPPTVALSAPANFAAGLTGTLAVNASASDNVGVAQVEFQIDGVAIGAADTTAPFGVTLDTTAHASGQHVLRARARDAAGNVSAWATATVQLGGARTQPAGITRTESGGLNSATAIAQAPDGRLFVTEQGGTLRVIKNGLAPLVTPFVTLAVDPQGERGLLGVALDPGFASNGYVYVYHTTTDNGTHNRISRFTASAANGDVAQAGSEVKLVDLPALSAATNHNGGALHFGVDGKLYVGVGENANTALAQNPNSPFGKMLRFNADGTIPSDNPFLARSGLARAIWASGLRNPFTFAVQPGTGRIHINDVGQGTWEEVNLGAPGANYGWPDSEGPTNNSGETAPLFAYKHSSALPPGSGPGGFFTGFAIAGGTFYSSNGALPAPWRGNYFFADYVSKFIGVIDLANGNAAYAFGSVTGSPVDLLAAADGSLLVLTRSGIVRFSAP